MKILFLTPRNSEKNLGGVEGHVRLLTEELERRGHEVKELSLDMVTSIASLDSSTRRKLLARNDRFLKFRAWGYLWKDRDLFKWADVVHIHDVFWWVMPFAIVNKGPALLRQQGRALKTKIFVTFHGWEGVCPPSWSAVWQKKLAAFLSDGTIGVGSFFEKWYGVTPNKVVFGVLDPNISIASLDSSTALGMTKNSLDCHVPLSRTRNDKPSIVFLGRMEEVNGIEILLGAIKVTPWRTPRCNLFRFIFVGEGSYRKQAEKFGKVTGMVKNTQKYLVDADIVITSSYMSMLEAAAMGKPVIAIGNSELKRDYLDEHPLRKWIKVVEDADELTKIIKGLYKGPALLQQQGRALNDLDRARIWARRQTPERLADVYEGLWNLK